MRDGNILENSQIIKLKDLENIFGRVVTHMLDTFRRMRKVDLEFISGIMVQSIEENGKIIKRMG
jgi:hypothetical protein